MLTHYLILDIATAPIVDAAAFIDDTVRAPANYKDADKIAEYVRDKTAERLALAATDPDLARLTGVGLAGPEVSEPGPWLCQTEADERAILTLVASTIRRAGGIAVVTYGGFNFDLPVLMRRARYLGVAFPSLNLDRYRSPHVDLCERLSDRTPQRRRPLAFYVRRLGWTDLVKPLTGAEEARVHETGAWEALAASIAHDLTATERLAEWDGVIEPVALRQRDEPVVG
ncbi:MAG: hypothetical protein OEW98_00180 [Betaproteobacteria bacterium]|nr:hypothetical protein [Betaproteobacteria bacterium]